MKSLEEQIEGELATAMNRIMQLAHSYAMTSIAKRLSVVPADSPGGGMLDSTTGTPPAKKSSRPQAAPGRRRRSAREISALSERLLEEVQKEPGLTMAVLAPRVGVSPTALQVPVDRLRAAKQLKTVGKRQFTTYFPVEAGADG